MAYAIRYNSASHTGMLVEMTAPALFNHIRAREAYEERWEAYWDTPEGSRPGLAPPEPTWPQYEAVSASQAHDWVRAGMPHETLLYIDSGKIRRA